MSHETISALLDGECSPGELDRLLDEMERSPELKLAYSRMVAAREARAGTRIARAQPDLCAGVMAGLDAVPGTAHPTVTEFAPPRARPRVQWKPLAGLAAAAMFGAVAVLVTLPQTADAPGRGASLVPQASVPTGVVPSARRAGRLQPVSASEDQLQQYLIDHSSALEDRGMGALPSARFAAHTAEYRPEGTAENRDER